MEKIINEKAISKDCPFYQANRSYQILSNGECVTTSTGFCKKFSTVCSCSGSQISCYSSKVRKFAISNAFSTELGKEYLYHLRCQMTSITRYVNNENPKHEREYKEMAKKAVDGILMMINGEIPGRDEKMDGTENSKNV